MKKILVVEDNEDLAKLVSWSLSKNYAVIVARDGVEALKILNDESFDLIITDYLMPNLNGLNFTRKALEAGVAQNIIVSSSFLNEEVKREFSDLGVQHFFSKPYQMQDLLVLLQEFFNRP